ncbi:MAG: hypothetical protein ACC653_07950 [Gammaproteobacteria bacterium]
MFFTVKKFVFTVFLLCLYLSNNLLYANEVTIEKAVFSFNGSKWSVDVTLKHADTGWKHYADAWRIVDAKGNPIAKRTLYHPHVKEQPFTRSLSSILIPEDSKVVYIEAHDTVHKWSSKKLEVDLINNKRSNVKIFR